MNEQANRPAYLSPIVEGIPEAIKATGRILLWKAVITKDKRWTKEPFQIDGVHHASTTNPNTWSAFPAAWAAYETGKSDGIGFVLNGDGIVGLDFDKCRCPAFDGVDESIAGGLDMILPEIADHLRKLNAYTEVSPSGRGIRVILKGVLPVPGTRKGPIEAYQSGRYVTITGRPLNGFPLEIEDRSTELSVFYEDIFGKKKEASKGVSPPLSRAESWQELLDRAFASKNGPAIKRLHDGDNSGYPSPSEADLAFAFHLAFWFGGDAVKMDEAFRASGRMRGKWDEQRGEQKYGQITIDKALAGCTEFYSGGDNWKEPIPLDGGLLLPDFPIDALPGTGKLFVEAVAEVTQVDAALPAMAYLAMLSACRAGDAVTLISHKEQCNLYIAAVLPSGHRKTSTVNLMSKPLFDCQHEQQLQSEVVIRTATNRFMVLESELKKMREKAAKAKSAEERREFLDQANDISEEMQANPVPTTPVFIVDDITTEQLGILMVENNDRMSIITAEGGIFKLMSGLYAKGEGNYDLYLKAHSGDPWSNHRVGRKSQTMMKPSLTMGLAIQPDVLDEIGKNKHFRGRGLIARFLFAICKSQVGYRARQTMTLPKELVERYREHIFGLMDMPPRREFALEPDAQAVWDEFYDGNECDLRPGGALEHITDWGSKLPGAVARIAGLLHSAFWEDQAGKQRITADTVSAACKIGNYFRENALIAFRQMEEDPRISVAKKILSYLSSHKPERFKSRDVLRHKHFDNRTVEEVEPGLQVLVERLYIRPVKAEYCGKGKPEGVAYEVNPRWQSGEDLSLIVTGGKSDTL
jgi:hypothetical protein